MSKTRLVLFLVLGIAGAVGGALLDELSPADPHNRVAAVLRRHQQLPLGETEALVAAALARDLGERAAEIEFLERAATGGGLAEVARVELAEALVGSDPKAAFDLVLPTLERAGTPELREVAVDITVRTTGPAITGQQRKDVERLAKRVPRSLRRKLQGAIADVTTQDGRRRLVALIRENSGDGAALAAARRLESLSDLTEAEGWLVARSLYRHAFYDEAAPRLESLAGGSFKGVPGWEVALLRGRCAFRVDDWQTAALWYRRALGMTTQKRNHAELEVHLARTLELAGRVDEAVEAARRAVIAETTDSRRLFLARLRLRTGRLDLAEAGIARVERSSNRARGRLLVALHYLGEGDWENALAMLSKVSRKPWRGPSRVLEAAVLVRAGRATDAVDRLEGVAGELEGFWGLQARQVMSSLPTEALDLWRLNRSNGIGKGGMTGRRDLVRLAVLEPDPARYAEIRRMVSSFRPLAGPEPKPRGVAGQLWDLGLSQQAVRWNPGGFPAATAREILWSASAFLDAGNSARAIRTADAGWRSRGADIPPQMYSDSLVSALYPLPTPEALMRTAAAGAVDPALVAGVAREESRWDPTVLSRVGARGLMQIMPRTATNVAARLGLPAPLPEDLFDPATSLELGSAELGRLSGVFDGFSPAAVAAYNAGEAQSGLWLDQCGDQCDAARFVLTVTFDATRGYTADVLVSSEVYRPMLRERIEGPDIARGSAQPSGRSRR